MENSRGHRDHSTLHMVYSTCSHCSKAQQHSMTPYTDFKEQCFPTNDKRKKKTVQSLIDNQRIDQQG